MSHVDGKKDNCFFCGGETSEKNSIAFNFCETCIKSELSLQKMYEKYTLASFIEKIYVFSKENMQSVDNRDCVFIDELIEYLQK